MKLSNLYFEEFTLKEFCNNIEEEYAITESAGEGLTKLLSAADKFIFPKFGIKKTDKSYYIAGSARLYIHQELREIFQLSQPLGDLDIVIPNKELWIRAGLGENFESDGIYRPEQKGMSDVEVFNIWDPRKAGEAYKNASPRPQEAIFNDANSVNGYFFMALIDVIDYKTKMTRPKELEVVNLMGKYNSSEKGSRTNILRDIVKVLGKDAARQFIGGMGK